MFDFYSPINMIDGFSYVFWMGDLNFRLDDVSRDDIIRYVEEDTFDQLLVNDQVICRTKYLFIHCLFIKHIDINGYICIGH